MRVSVRLVPGWWHILLREDSVIKPQIAPNANGHFPQREPGLNAMSCLFNHKPQGQKTWNANGLAGIAELPATWSATGGIVWSGFHLHNTNFPLCPNKRCIAGCPPLSFPCLVWRQSRAPDITQTVNSRHSINRSTLSGLLVNCTLWGLQSLHSPANSFNTSLHVSGTLEQVQNRAALLDQHGLSGVGYIRKWGQYGKRTTGNQSNYTLSKDSNPNRRVLDQWATNFVFDNCN